ncbi:hypothetical protein CB0940_10369 [Cercospora beticola]|uniref:Cyclochlorotine biosynthesis protein O n=1 Tax=Cercospora beticola TaxID=122368 RepID=A0A2G5HUJ1_CERBT|nr:hypothetical protein CB0940_10369 [Cercospora beticola]PIA96206.1 hypothetical protein CB0940_10369 [Cercospora beticola]WPB07083.1 hypothetical protein RHO25_011743 [Cercospora beticola]CAK1367031.1 unnamed protein product [Cercospora beticola]
MVPRPTVFGRGRLSTSDDDSEEYLLGDNSSTSRTKHTWCRVLAIAQTCTTLLLTVILLQNGGVVRRQEGLAAATAYGNLDEKIRFIQKPFVNPIQPSDDGEHLEIWWDQSSTRYAGPPSLAVDLAWDALLTNTVFNVSIHDEVAKPALTRTYIYEDGNITLGFEVYHALHCLNVIRLMLDPETYIFNELAQETSIHRYHCMDYLRQYIQCNADLTPMFAFKKGDHALLLKPYALHSCRDIDQLNGWISEHRTSTV